MNSKQSPYSHIWQPIQIGNVEVKNRILMTAMTSNYAEDYIIATGTSRSIASAPAVAPR